MMAGPTLGALLARRADASAGQRAIVAADGMADFAALHAGADRAAAAFAALGVGHGDRVGLLLPAGLRFAEAFFGLARLGAVACGLNTRLSGAELAAIAAGCGHGAAGA
jgi:acyl-CoA synthetase (AMP-forming)/AMP-acid ligase II